jgi:hypothetical protein
VLAGLDRRAYRLLPLRGDLGVEVDLGVVGGERLAQICGPALQPVGGGERPHPLRAAPDQDRLGPDGGPVRQRHAALLTDGEDRPDEVLP